MSKEQIEERNIYRFKASLKHVDDDKCFEVPFSVMTEDVYKAKALLLEWLKDPKQTGYRFECCVGITNEPSGMVLVEAGYRRQSENVVLLPFKVDDTVYVPWRWAGQRGIATVRVEEIKFYDSQMHYMFLIDMESDNECFNKSFGGWKTDRCVGKTVFLTREEAEAHMKGGAE